MTTVAATTSLPLVTTEATTDPTCLVVCTEDDTVCRADEWDWCNAEAEPDEMEDCLAEGLAVCNEEMATCQPNARRATRQVKHRNVPRTMPFVLTTILVGARKIIVTKEVATKNIKSVNLSAWRNAWCISTFVRAMPKQTRRRREEQWRNALAAGLSKEQ